MKFTVRFLCVLLLSALLCTLLAACNDDDDDKTYTHEAKSTWSSTADKHWKECNCSDPSCKRTYEEGGHTFDATGTCTVCSHKKEPSAEEDDDKKAGGDNAEGVNPPQNDGNKPNNSPAIPFS